MIQRQQTLWLLLAIIAGVLCFMFPFATGEEIVAGTTMRQRQELVAGEDFYILILLIASVGLAAITIFLYQDRKLQIKLCLLGILLSLGTIIRYVIVMNKMLTPTPALWCILPVLVMLGFFLAFRNTRKDERLVKSLDKLR